MKSKNLVRLTTVTFGLMFASLVFAKSPVFKVSKGGDHVYIGGTIHLLSENDYPLPQAFTTAFGLSDHIYFETDTSQASSPEVQLKMGKMMALPENETLVTALNEQTYERLKAHLNERNLDITAFNLITPSAVSIALTVYELQLLGLGDPQHGVDHFFASQTSDANKKAFYLESLEEQISFLGQFNNADPNLIINSNLDDLSSLGESWKKALNAWRKGDIESMSVSLGGESLKTDFPAIYKVLLSDRNNRWLADIKAMFNSKEVELVLVGALHLAYDDGLIELLRKDGYEIEQLD